MGQGVGGRRLLSQPPVGCMEWSLRLRKATHGTSVIGAQTQKKEEVMALFGRDYDRDYGYNARPRGERPYGAGPIGYDRNYGPGYTGAGYGRGGQSEPMGYDADHGYKSRWQTDFGDPYGDRASHTPFRVMRGEFHGYGRDFEGGYDRGYRGSQTGRPRQYGANPMSYDPHENEGRMYQSRPGNWERGGRGSQDSERGRWGQGSDRGWGGMDRSGRGGPNAGRGGYQGYSENRYDTGWF